MTITITDFHRLQSAPEIEACARLMAASDPWLTLGISYDACKRMLSDASRETWAAAVDGNLAGCCVLLMQGPFKGYIQSIMIAPEMRSQGVGAQLLAFIEERVFTETPNMFLCVSSFNQRAQQFYTRAGYETIGVLKDFLVSGHDEILMRKSLGPLRAYRPPD